MLNLTPDDLRMAHELGQEAAQDGELFPRIDFDSWFYKNCQRQRQRGAKICQECPFRAGIEEQERNRAHDV